MASWPDGSVPSTGIEKTFARRSCTKADSGLGTPVMLTGMTIGHSKPFAACTVTRETDSCSASGRGLSDGFFPVGAHVTRERAQSAHAVGAGHFKKEIDVCNGPFRTSLEPLPKLRPHVQGGDRVSEQNIGCGRPGTPAQGLEACENRARRVMGDVGGIRPQAKRRRLRSLAAPRAASSCIS